jgi:ribosomal protein L7/L12
MVKRINCQYCGQAMNADVMECPKCGLPGPLKSLEAQLLILVMQGNKPEAMKRVMHLTGYGLKESKDYVDSL